ncbi:BRO-N domain-containing protein [Actinomyces wuliandei]|uniref:BRO-N domain-containing protein n=1 Tax=Actinomyces wuliandei TaxID=2057743 RepID=UPI001C56287C|nr:BRO family protein [Actinomyces wuliandei]
MTASTTVTPFTYHDYTVRTLIDSEGATWFLASDVGDVLNLSNIHSSLSRLDDDERGLHTMETPTSSHEVAIISEAGLYTLILRSRRPEAKAFRRWVTHEVLPQLRRTGAYQTTTRPAHAEEEPARSEQIEVPRPSTYLPATWDLLIVTGTDTHGQRFTDEIMYRTPDGTGYASIRSRGGRPAHTVT